MKYIFARKSNLDPDQQQEQARSRRIFVNGSKMAASGMIGLICFASSIFCTMKVADSYNSWLEEQEFEDAWTGETQKRMVKEWKLEGNGSDYAAAGIMSFLLLSLSAAGSVHYSKKMMRHVNKEYDRYHI